MDRQAWIAVTLCVLGLIGWQVYVTTHAPRLAPAPVATASPNASSAPSPAATTSAPPVAANSATPAAGAADQSATTPTPETTAAFEEKFETLANADVELRLTNRGGAIAEAHLLHHKADTPQGHVILDSREHFPIGAIIE